MTREPASQNLGSYIGGTVSPVLTGMVDATRSFALAIGAGVMIAGVALYFLVVQDPIPLEAVEGEPVLHRAVAGADQESAMSIEVLPRPAPTPAATRTWT